MTSRKNVRVTIPVHLIPVFRAAKARAEEIAMFKMSDTQYASRLMQWALEQQEKPKPSQ